ncbi:MAG: TadE family protein [Candidatus Sulfotelmatobacter sp.]
MSNRLHRSTWKVRVFRRLRAEDRASQIVEFALSLPLLVLFVVGIFDFSGAISLKQKLTNAAREAARVAAADPANDLSSTVPASVTDAIYVVDNYLISEKINDCGLVVAGALPAPTTQSALTWTYSASGSGCPGSGITIQVNRGCSSTIPSGGNTVNLIETCVAITYPYKWQYSSVTGLLGITFVGPTGITTTASAFNEN